MILSVETIIAINYHRHMFYSAEQYKMETVHILPQTSGDRRVLCMVWLAFGIIKH